MSSGVRRIKEDDALCFFTDDDGDPWVGPAYVLYACLGGNPDQADALIRGINQKKLFSKITATESAEMHPTDNVIWTVNCNGIVAMLQRSSKEIASLTEKYTMKYVLNCFNETFQNPIAFRENLPKAELRVLSSINSAAVPTFHRGTLYFPEDPWFDICRVPKSERTKLLLNATGSTARDYYDTQTETMITHQSLMPGEIKSTFISMVSFDIIRAVIYRRWPYFITYELHQTVKSFIRRPYILVPDRKGRPQLYRQIDEAEHELEELERKKKAAVIREDFLVAHTFKEQIDRARRRITDLKKTLREKVFPKTKLHIQKCIITTPLPPGMNSPPPLMNNTTGTNRKIEFSRRRSPGLSNEESFDLTSPMELDLNGTDDSTRATNGSLSDAMSPKTAGDQSSSSGGNSPKKTGGSPPSASSSSSSSSSSTSPSTSEKPPTLLDSLGSLWKSTQGTCNKIEKKKSNGRQVQGDVGGSPPPLPSLHSVFGDKQKQQPNSSVNHQRARYVQHPPGESKCNPVDIDGNEPSIDVTNRAPPPPPPPPSSATHPRNGRHPPPQYPRGGAPTRVQIAPNVHPRGQYPPPPQHRQAQRQIPQSNRHPQKSNHRHSQIHPPHHHATHTPRQPQAAHSQQRSGHHNASQPRHPITQPPPTQLVHDHASQQHHRGVPPGRVVRTWPPRVSGHPSPRTYHPHHQPQQPARTHPQHQNPPVHHPQQPHRANIPYHQQQPPHRPYPVRTNYGGRPPQRMAQQRGPPQPGASYYRQAAPPPQRFPQHPPYMRSRPGMPPHRNIQPRRGAYIPTHNTVAPPVMSYPDNQGLNELSRSDKIPRSAPNRIFRHPPPVRPPNHLPRIQPNPREVVRPQRRPAGIPRLESVDVAAQKLGGSSKPPGSAKLPPKPSSETVPQPRVAPPSKENEEESDGPPPRKKAKISEESKGENSNDFKDIKAPPKDELRKGKTKRSDADSPDGSFSISNENVKPPPSRETSSPPDDTNVSHPPPRDEDMRPPEEDILSCQPKHDNIKPPPICASIDTDDDLSMEIVGTPSVDGDSPQSDGSASTASSNVDDIPPQQHDDDETK